MRRSLVALSLCVFTLVHRTVPSFGQSGSKDRGIPHWPDINLNVLVVDKSEQPDTTLDKSAVRLFEDGVERQVASAATGDAPVSLALLIDTSGSANSAMGSSESLTAAIIQELPKGSEVMAVLFADEASIGLPFTSAPPVPLSFLNRLKGHGGTALYDALLATEAYVEIHAKFARRSIVVLSDGEDTASRHNLQDAVRSVQEPGTPMIYFVAQWDSRALASERSRTERNVRSIVSAAGGVMILPSKKQDATSIGAHTASLIRSQYSIVFTTSDPATDGKSHKLELRVERPNLKIITMPLYFAPTK
jgi:Ca-activated chloride channel homolog